MPNPVAAIAGGSSLLGAASANKAAKAQSRAADQSLALQREMYDQTREDLGGYRAAGDRALQAYLYEMGLGQAPTVGGRAPSIETVNVPGTTGGGYGAGAPGRAFPPASREMRERDLAMRQMGWGGAGNGTPGRTEYRVGGKTFGTLEEAQAWANANPTGGSAYRGFTATPGYEFRFNQGVDAANALAGARGGLNSGRTMQDLMAFGQGIASQEYGNYMNRLAGIIDSGQASAANTAQASNSFAAMGSNSLGAKGNAAAAGAIGVNNALQGGLQGGIGLWQYQNELNRKV